MMDIDIRGLVPRFILRDQNGYAMAKALEAGLNAFLAVAQGGLDTWGNVDKMPEWRLDEMAWEYGIPFDYTADAEVKRAWIRDAWALSRLYGTLDGMRRYLAGYFDGAEVVEAADYSGDPYHFRIDLTGEWNAAKVAWAQAAAEATKNVRSVLDGMRVLVPEIKALHQLYVGLALYGAEMASFGATENPDLDAEGFLVDERGNYLMDERGIALTDE